MKQLLISLLVLMACTNKKESNIIEVSSRNPDTGLNIRAIYDSVDSVYVTSITGLSGPVAKKKEHQFKSKVKEEWFQADLDRWIGRTDEGKYISADKWTLPVYEYPDSVVEVDTAWFRDYLIDTYKERFEDTIQVDFLVADTTPFPWNGSITAVDSLGNFIEEEVDYAYPVGLEKGYIVIKDLKIKEYLTKRKKPLGKNIIVVQ